MIPAPGPPALARVRRVREPGRFPDVLRLFEKDKALPVPKGILQGLWFALSVPGDAIAGAYPVSVTVRNADGETIAYMHSVVKLIAKNLGIDESGFRLVVNTGADGMQSVKHLHMHILGGRSMQWPPG